jgi:recombination protein RecA
MTMKLSDLEAAVNKGIGSSLITHLNDEKGDRKIQGISTGSMALNLALSGTPSIGFEYGRIVEMVGPEGCSKTTLALHCVAEAQKLDLPCLYIDVENALDPVYMKHLGIDLTKLSVLQPDYGEAALNAAINGVKEGYRLIIVDSVAALSPKAELDGEVGDSHMGLTARMMGQALRKISALVNKKRAIVIFINQIRMKIGVMFGSPETSPGGMALRYAASYRIDLRAPRGGKVEDKDMVAGNTEVGVDVNLKVIKNKTFPPYRHASYRILFGKGIDKYLDVVNYLDKKGLLDDGKLVYNKHRLSKKQLYVEIKTDKALRQFILKLIKDDANPPKKAVE